jgi:hypothetical protein
MVATQNESVFYGMHRTFTCFWLRFQYSIKADCLGRLMRYYLLFLLAKSFLTSGIIEASGATLLILFSRATQ